jgi:Tfp pilus assembly protein PilX
MKKSTGSREEKMRSQRGVALILVMVLLFVLSVMAVSMMFLSQTETWSSMNYRMMTQARYGAEAGLDKAVNYLLNTYAAPTTSGTDPLSNYNTAAVNKSATINGETISVGVTDTAGNPIVLSSNSAVTANYPISSVQTAFNSNAGGSFAAGNVTVNYTAYAVLTSMSQITPYGSTTPKTIQTWRIVGDGTISTAVNATVEVASVLETQSFPVFSYAAFATSNGCGALTFGGGGTTDSYDSATYTSTGSLGIQTTGGNVGTNGNLTTNGNTTNIDGNLSTPRSGTGTCSNGNVTAWTDTSGHVNGQIIELQEAITYPDPVIPSPGTLDLNGSCPSGFGTACSQPTTAPNCNGSSNCITFDPSQASPSGTINLQNITLTGHDVLQLKAGTYNINSLSETGNNVSIQILSGPVIINVCGAATNGGACGSVNHTTGATTGSTGTVFDITGSSVTNSTLVPNNLLINYDGAGTVKLAGGSNAAGLLYAPNATFSFKSATANWYGAVIGATLADQGGETINYDRELLHSAVIVSNPSLGAFTWKKY